MSPRGKALNDMITNAGDLGVGVRWRTFLRINRHALHSRAHGRLRRELISIRSIGKVVEISKQTLTITAKVRYGLQSVRLRVSVLSQGDDRSLIQVQGFGDDIWGGGARKGTDKLLRALERRAKTSAAVVNRCDTPVGKPGAWASLRGSTETRKANARQPWAKAASTEWMAAAACRGQDAARSSRPRPAPPSWPAPSALGAPCGMSA